MARTWPVTRRKQLALAAFDRIAGPVASVFLREKPVHEAAIEKILVVELWHIGDVVLATAALRRLRTMYPEAKITLLAKEHARELLQGSPLVDDIVTYDFPWTSTMRKYDPTRYDVSAIRGIVNELKSRRFDLSIDSRMDLRSNLLTRSIGAARRLGYDFGGGGFLLTDAVPVGAADRHKVDDWMALLDVLGAATAEAPEPMLNVSEQERMDARRVLRSYGVEEGELVVGIHPGGSHEAKRWSEANFAETGKTLASSNGARVLVFVDPDGCGSDMDISPNAIFVRTSIREMMALLTHCEVLICNDSGPMHIAAALGVPVVALFKTGDPAAYGPRGMNHTVVGTGATRGGPSGVDVESVIAAAQAQLERIRASSRTTAETAR